MADDQDWYMEEEDDINDREDEDAEEAKSLEKTGLPSTKIMVLTSIAAHRDGFMLHRQRAAASSACFR